MIAPVVVCTLGTPFNKKKKMSVIEIQRHHTLDHAHAVETADKLARELSSRFDVRYTWDGDTLHFSRTGARGTMTVEPNQIHIRMELGFLLRPMKGKIEKSIHDHLDGLIDNV